jgi:tRNA (guanine-N7-)-methyltransferase
VNSQNFDERSKLPLSHPNYRYPPSKNPYAQKALALKEWISVENDTETHAGVWRNQFMLPSGGAPLWVELGCNGGHVSLEWAAQNPETRIVGVDWKVKQIVFGAEKAQKRGLKNIRFFRANLERLPFMFGEGEIDRLHMFFPDPWPKKSMWKHRQLNKENLRKWAPLLKPATGEFWIKTDHAGYFDWMLKALEANKDVWDVVELSRDLHAGNPHPELLEIPVVTLFEKLFIKDKLPIHSLKLRRKKA